MTNQIPEEDRKKIEDKITYLRERTFPVSEDIQESVDKVTRYSIEWGYTLGLQSAEKRNEWIKVKDSKELLDPDVTATFLIHVVNDKTKNEYWEIITGYLDDTGAILNQHDDEYVGWDYSDVIYYKPITDLPPLSK